MEFNSVISYTFLFCEAFGVREIETGTLHMELPLNYASSFQAYFKEILSCSRILKDILLYGSIICIKTFVAYLCHDNIPLLRHISLNLMK